MREQSHIDDMRAAIRGDLERARARRPSIFERPSVSVVPEVRDEELVEAPEPEPVVGAEPELEVAAAAREPEPEVAVAEVPREPERRPGLIARLFRR